MYFDKQNMRAIAIRAEPLLRNRESFRSIMAKEVHLKMTRLVASIKSTRN